LADSRSSLRPAGAPKWASPVLRDAGSY
jgi:hypothetical protein